MDRYLVLSSDGHVGLPPGGYREYLDPKYRETFDAAMKIQIARTREAEKLFLVKEINEEWRRGRDHLLTGAWDHDARLEVIDGDGIAGEVLFPDGITEMNAPPFGAGIGFTPKGADRELQWAGARSHNRWLAEFCQMAPERRHGVAIVPATWDVAEAVKEVRWARANGIGSIMLPVIWGDHAPYHHPCYRAALGRLRRSRRGRPLPFGAGRFGAVFRELAAEPRRAPAARRDGDLRLGGRLVRRAAAHVPDLGRRLRGLIRSSAS